MFSPISRALLVAKATLLVILLTPVVAWAQPVLQMDAAPETIRNALTESLRRAQTGAGAASGPVTVQTAVPPSVGFMIEFDFDSARLTLQGAVFLGRIIEIIRTTPQLAGARLLIDGHTDGVGSRGYNQRLGQARANTIAAAMVEQGIPYFAIYARSFGEDRPLFGLSPFDGRNRRVEITPF